MGRGNKNFKKGGQAGSRGGCLEKGGARTMTFFCNYYANFDQDK